MVRVRVPASSANIGPGFDSLGVALTMYNTAEFSLTETGLEIEIMDGAEYIPTGETNYVYVGFKKVFDSLSKSFNGVKIRLWSDIPVTKGLGSSSSSIVLGLMGANKLLGDPYTREQLVKLACDIEGHPDNVTPALLGGFTIASAERDRIAFCRTDVSDGIRFAAMIPDFYFQTKKSRGILPGFVPLRNATYNIGHASLVSAAFISGNYSLLEEAVRDRIHQRYRFSKIRSGEFVARSLRRNGALCSYLSGAGPTIMGIVDKDYEQFEEKMNTLIATNLKGWRLVMLSADNEGAIYI